MSYMINESEYRFMQVLWRHEPVNSTELVRLSLAELGWKKSTTYTVIRNLAQKEVVKNEDTIVSALVTKEEIDKERGEDYLDKAFQGSVPDMFAAFLKDRELTREDIERIKKIIEEV